MSARCVVEVVAWEMDEDMDEVVVRRGPMARSKAEDVANRVDPFLDPDKHFVRVVQA